MRRSGPGWIVGLLLLVSSQIAAEDARAAVLGGDTTALLGECLAALDVAPGEPIDLAARCPRAAQRVALARREGLVEGIGGDGADLESLRDLHALSAGFDRAAVPGAIANLDFAGLDALLDEVLIEEADSGWWQRFLEWLKSKLPEESDADYGWLVDWLEDLDVPRWVTDLVYHLSVVTIVLLALLVVANEVRASGLLRRRWRQRVAALPAGGSDAGSSVPRGLDELSGLTPRERAAAALALVVHHLAERGLISERASLTTGELEREVRRSRATLAAPFHELIAAVEVVVYGDREPDQATERALLASARTLLEASA